MTQAAVARPTLIGHVKIARVDHWVKNVFVLPGIVAGSAVQPWDDGSIVLRVIAGMASVCLVASSNYTINEVLDAPSDLHHPTKKLRPVPAGEVNVPLAYVQWLGLLAAGLGLGSLVSTPFVVTMAILWIMGCIYNIPPIRSKDRAYIDVLSEAVNNPLRLLAGWWIVGATVVPSLSLLLSYWMVGCYFMAIKRFAEFRDINDQARAARYRPSFGYYDADKLLVSVMFYGSAAMLFFGAFSIRYRLELVLTYPLVALVMAEYLRIGLKPHSAAQAPEKLHREPLLMAAVVFCAIAMGAALFVDIPVIYELFAPSMPTPAAP
jgi:decaprenyl-phosphate phosphoribosyltransferase